MTIKGYTAEVEDAYAAALAALRRPARPGPRSIRSCAISPGSTSAERRSPRRPRSARRSCELAEGQDDQLMRLDGHLILGTVLMFAGDLPALAGAARRGHRRIRGSDLSSTPTPDGHGPPGLLSGRVRVRPVGAWVPGPRGRAIEPRRRPRAATLDPYSLAYGLFHSGVPAPVAVGTAAGRRNGRGQLLERATDHDFPIWRAVGTGARRRREHVPGPTGGGPRPDRAKA